jgi:regulator of protease activity HflC (stomatin/prohibitin superfamily)
MIFCTSTSYFISGQRQAAINVAEGNKQSVILASEAEKAEQINKASGRQLKLCTYIIIVIYINIFKIHVIR